MTHTYRQISARVHSCGQAISSAALANWPGSLEDCYFSSLRFTSWVVHSPSHTHILQHTLASPLLVLHSNCGSIAPAMVSTMATASLHHGATTSPGKAARFGVPLLSPCQRLTGLIQSGAFVWRAVSFQQVYAVKGQYAVPGSILALRRRERHFREWCG